MQKLKSIFSKPFPYEDSFVRRIVIILGFGIFVASFLLIFQPFKISSVQSPHKNLIIGGYGFVTIAVMAISSFVPQKIMPNYFKESEWTLGKEFLGTLGEIVFIAFGNSVYSSLTCIQRTEHFSAPQIVGYFLIMTAAVGFFPVLFYLLIYYNIQLRRNLKKATEINQNIAVKKRDETKSNRSEKLITIAVNQKNALNISKENLICVEAEDNYVNIHYTNSDRYKKEMIRSTLKKMEEQLSENQQFVRCHKSFIVNLQKLQHVKGNAQGYKLKLEGLDFEIPVSRKLSKTILEKIAS